jgi:RNA-binding protein
LERLGKVLHITSSKSIIIKAEKHARIGDKVVDENLRRVGKIFDLFGPVSSPYISVKAETDDPLCFVDKILYVAPSEDVRRGKRR